MMKIICFCISLFCIILFILNLVLGILRYIKVKKIHKALIADQKYPSRINAISHAVYRLSLLFILFSAVGSSMWFLFGELDTAFDFAIYIALPVGVLFTCLSLFSLSKWDSFWVFDKTCFYKNSTKSKFEYSEILFAYVYCSSTGRGYIGWFANIKLANKKISIGIYRNYVEKIKIRLSAYLSDDSIDTFN